MNLLQRINHYCTDHQLIKPDQPVIVGLSGGPDSVFLLHMLVKLRASYNLHIIAAHLDHGWRIDSSADAEFCKEYAQQLEVDYIDAHARDILLAKKFNGSAEEQGRMMRRNFFESIASQYMNSVIALGHHQNDLHETFFTRLIRGASLTGLVGIRPKQGLYIHPLLSITKQEILHYLAENSLVYRIDSTNENLAYLRNRIRLHVIPTLSSCDARSEKSLSSTLTQLAEAETFCEEITQEVFTTISILTQDKYALISDSFKKLRPYLQKRVLLQWLIAEKVPFTPSNAYLNEIIRFIMHSHKSNQHLIHASPAIKWYIKKQKNSLFITKNNSSSIAI